jgi:omega-hydroxy-beta-dihydromenaquinone-9 sulfotransferase
MATADADASKRFVFVLGTGRCGSTVVEEVLCRHPDVGFVSNVEDRFSLPPGAGRWNGSLYRHLPAAASQKGRLRFAPSEGYRALDREVSPLIGTPFRDLLSSDVTPWLERRARAFFLERAHAQDTDTFLHKFTGWPRAGFLARIFPTARFIHVVRDGRAVANSWLQMPWWLGYNGPDNWQWGALPPELAAEWDASGRSFVVLAGLLWRLLIEAHDQARAELPNDRWLEVKYEDVATRPRDSFESLLDFCELEWEGTFERGFARHAFSASRTDAFRRDLESADVARLTRTLEQTLSAHAYDTSD